MVFWIGILVGGALAWFAVKKGFYETWILLFNVLIGVYLGVFLGPVIVNNFVDSQGAYTNAIAMLVTAAASFLILYGISYILFTSQFSVSLGKLLDVVGAGVLGFLTGLLIWSFVSIVICLTPVSENSFVKEIGLTRKAQQTNISYTCWWCDLVNSMVSVGGKNYSTEQTISKLLKQAEKDRLKRKSKPKQAPEPNDLETNMSNKTLLNKNLFCVGEVV